MNYALGKMKNGKAPGEDMTPAEILKRTLEEGIQWISEMVNKCWDEGKTPEEWNRSVICPIFKKGDKTDCRNYREIALMPHIAKVYNMILEKRLKIMVENRLAK